MTEDFLRQLAEFERMTVQIDEEDIYDEENDIMEMINNYMEPETVVTGAEERAAELMKEINIYREAMHDARSALRSAEDELDATLEQIM